MGSIEKGLQRTYRERVPKKKEKPIRVRVKIVGIGIKTRWEWRDAK